MLTIAIVAWLSAGGALIPPPRYCDPGMPLYADCYLTLTDRDDCDVRLGDWDGWRVTDNYEAVFSGTCTSNLIAGPGTLRLTNSDGEWREFEGEFDRGHPDRALGDLAEPLKAGRHADGLVVREGLGKPMPLWLIKSPDGWEMEGPIKNGRRHGYWIERHPLDGTRRGRYRDGHRHGGWVEEYAGRRERGWYEYGKRDNMWGIEWTDDRYEVGNYKAGERNGVWYIVLGHLDGRTVTVAMEWVNGSPVAARLDAVQR